MIEKLFRLTAEFDACDMLYWNQDLDFFITYEDTSLTANRTEIKTEEDLEIFRKCLGIDQIYADGIYYYIKTGKTPLESDQETIKLLKIYGEGN